MMSPAALKNNYYSQTAIIYIGAIDFVVVIIDDD